MTTIEEKARRYDEILARATGAYLPYYTEDIMSKVKEFVEYLIPELKESEGERIRKEIILFVKGNIQDEESEQRKTYLTWLEKQGEQKPVEMSRVEDSQYYYNIHRILKGLKCNGDYSRTAIDAAINWLDGIKNFGYTKWSKEDEELRNLLCGRLIYSNIQEKEKFVMWLGKLTPIKQKPDEWTAEDEEELKIALNTLEKAGQYCSAKWLKNVCLVPQKIQKPTEWSEDDQSNFNELSSFIFETYRTEDASRLITWLKSLKDRYTWRPSAEQLKVLKEACVLKKSTATGAVLCELYHDLEKLREE